MKIYLKLEKHFIKEEGILEMYCFKCGGELKDDFSFCPKCGEKNSHYSNSKVIKKNENDFSKRKVISDDGYYKIINNLDSYFGRLKNTNRLLIFSIYFFICFFVISSVMYGDAFADISIIPLLLVAFLFFGILNFILISNYGYDPKLKIQISVILFFTSLASLYINYEDSVDKLFNSGDVFTFCSFVSLIITVINFIIFNIVSRELKKAKEYPALSNDLSQ